MQKQSSWLRAYILLAWLWGLSFLFIMVGLESLTPIQVAFGRLFVGTLTLWILVAAKRPSLAMSRAGLGHLFVLALLLNSVPGLLFAYAETFVSSILASIMNATTPLFGLLATLTIFREQRPVRAQQIGLVIGFAGVLVVLGVWQGIGATTLQGIALCAVAVALYGISFPYGRRFLTPLKYSPISASAVQVGFGLAQLLPLMLIPQTFAPTTRSLVAVIALGALASGLAYILNFTIIAQAGAIVASTVTYWTPLVAVIAGVLILGESTHWYEPVGALIVLAGVMIAQQRWPFAGRTLR
jgi:drug/metabolite transporter (DMT)-like permease